MKNEAKLYGRIGVLMGGYSSERKISLKSGSAVLKALNEVGCDVIGIDIVEQDSNKIEATIGQANIDLAFIALHGACGEDGIIQTILDQLKVIYTGSSAEASRKAINKAISQKIFQNKGISVPKYVTLSQVEVSDEGQIIQSLGSLPVIVKPACEGSSMGITIVHEPAMLRSAIKEALSFCDSVLVEKYIEGREITVGIIRDEALPIVEICPKTSYFDFEAKYEKGKTDYIVPADLSTNVTKQIQQIALSAHRLLGCSDFSRVDFMLDRQDNPFLLEINTIPGFTETSLLPKAAKEKGLNFNELCLTLIDIAYGKKKANKNVVHSY